MQDGLEMIYEQMLKPKVLKEENMESVRHSLPKDVYRILQEIKTIQRTDNMERELALKVDKLTSLLNYYIPAQKKQPVQIFRKGERVK